MATTLTTASTTTTLYRFDPSVDGGAAGGHPLAGDPIPPGAIVIDALVRIEAPFKLVAGPHNPRDIVRLAVLLGARHLIAHVSLSNAYPGTVLRSELPTRARTVVANGELPTVGIEPSGTRGYAEGALTVAVTWMALPEI